MIRRPRKRPQPPVTLEYLLLRIRLQNIRFFLLVIAIMGLSIAILLYLQNIKPRQQAVNQRFHDQACAVLHDVDPAVGGRYIQDLRRSYPDCPAYDPNVNDSGTPSSTAPSSTLGSATPTPGSSVSPGAIRQPGQHTAPAVTVVPQPGPVTRTRTLTTTKTVPPGQQLPADLCPFLGPLGIPGLGSLVGCPPDLSNGLLGGVVQH